MENKEVLATLQIANTEVRFVLAEFHNGKLNILHVARQKHQGMKLGKITSESSISKAIKQILEYVTDAADIREGDLLVTSGMGQRFPVGYPVAVVSEVQRNTGQPFARIQALPAASLNRSRYMLLVFSNSKSSTQALDEEVQNALEDAKQLLKATETTAAEAQ